MEDFQCSHIRLLLLIFIADQPVKTSILRQGARHIYPTVEEKHVYEYWVHHIACQHPKGCSQHSHPIEMPGLYAILFSWWNPPYLDSPWLSHAHCCWLCMVVHPVASSLYSRHGWLFSSLNSLAIPTSHYRLSCPQSPSPSPVYHHCWSVFRALMGWLTLPDLINIQFW